MAELISVYRIKISLDNWHRWRVRDAHIKTAEQRKMISSLETELDTIILSSGRYTIQSRMCPCVCGEIYRLWQVKIWNTSRILDTC